MPPIKVLQFITPTGLFGAERWILALGRNFAGHPLVNCQLAVTQESTTQNIEVNDRFKQFGLSGHIVKMNGSFDPLVILSLVKLIRQEKINIIHTHGYKSDILGLLAAKKAGIKTLSTPHGFENSKDLKLQTFIRLGCFSLRYFDIVAPLSEKLKDDLLKMKIQATRIKLINNGVDLDEIEDVKNLTSLSLKKDPQEKLIGYVGQLATRKNIGALIDAFDLLYKVRQDIRLLLIGEGPQKDELEQKANQLESGCKIEFLGYRDDRLQLVKQMALFSMTSSLEGIPRCMMEAMALRVPVAAFDIPGVDKLIIHGKTGLMAEFGDIYALKDCFEKILSSQEDAALLANRGRQHILTNYSAKRMAEEYFELYKKLIA